MIFSLPLAALAREVQPGDTLAKVRIALGAPRGQLRIGDRQVLYYDQGEVELCAGLVARADLRTPGQQAVFTAERAATEQQILEENRRLVTEGLALKARQNLAEQQAKMLPPPMPEIIPAEPPMYVPAPAYGRPHYFSFSRGRNSAVFQTANRPSANSSSPHLHFQPSNPNPTDHRRH